MTNLSAKDLRSGNLIYEIKDTPENPSLKEVFEVAAVNSLTDTIISTDDNITQIEYCEPIKLTPELLEAAGFHDQFGGCYSLDGFVVDYSHTNKTFKILGNNKTIYLEYLHELQNAYYLNEKQELTINLNQLQQA